MNSLRTGEYKLWSGRPVGGNLIEKQDMFMIPFSIFWLAFALFWTLTAMQESFTFGLFGIPFVCVGMYLAIGRFIIKAKKRNNSEYLVTNQRVVRYINGNIDYKELNSIQDMHMSMNPKGTGNIYFENDSITKLMMNSRNNMGVWNGDVAFGFYNIENVDKVAQIINQAISDHHKDKVTHEDHMFIQCKGCGATIASDTKYCPYCGKANE